ncbi:60S ribosomal protein L17 [Dictyocoela muelleri]|nr:60S ribosomal protein L17 [Dictyocoela muelleri]
MSKKFSVEIEDPANSVFLKLENANIKFKNTRETSVPLRKKSITKAINYLKDVINFKQCVPITRYGDKCGRTPQAKAFGKDKGRWPQRPARFLIKVLNDLITEAEKKGLNPDELVIKHISINKAPKMYGRKHGAFGRVCPYNRTPCHIEIIAGKVEPVIKSKN